MAKPKLTDDAVRRIVLDPRPYRAIARDFGVSMQTVHGIKHCWTHKLVSREGMPPLGPRKRARATPDLVRHWADMSARIRSKR